MIIDSAISHWHMITKAVVISPRVRGRDKSNFPTRSKLSSLFQISRFSFSAFSIVKSRNLIPAVPYLDPFYLRCRGWERKFAWSQKRESWMNVKESVTRTSAKKRLRQHQQRPFSHRVSAELPEYGQAFLIPEPFQICIRRLATLRPSGSKDWHCDVQRILMLIKHSMLNGWWAITRRLDSVSGGCSVERIKIASRYINSSNCLFLSICTIWHWKVL